MLTGKVFVGKQTDVEHLKSKSSIMSEYIYLKSDRVKYWWISLLAGLLSVAAGVGCFCTPVASLAALSVFFIAVMLAGGIFNIVFAIANNRRSEGWGWNLARGIVELLLGIWMWMLPLPFVTATLVYILGFWMLFYAILGICESCELQRYGLKRWWVLLLCNILSLICAFIYLSMPAFGGLFMLIYVACSFILYGIYRIWFAFEVRQLNEDRKSWEA